MLIVESIPTAATDGIYVISSLGSLVYMKKGRPFCGRPFIP